MKTETEPAHDPLPENAASPVQLSRALAKKRATRPRLIAHVVNGATYKLRMSKENPLWGAPRIHGEPEKPKPSYSEERNTKTATVTATPTPTPKPAPIATPMPMLATAAPTPAPSTTPTNTLNGKAATPQREILCSLASVFSTDSHNS